MVKVYRYKVYDTRVDRYLLSPRMITREGATLLRKRQQIVMLLEDSEAEIHESQLELGEQWTRETFRL